MIRTIARLALLRFLPRRLLPILTAWEFLRLIRSRRDQNASTPTGTPSGTSSRRPRTSSPRPRTTRTR